MALAAVGLASCVNDLDVENINPQQVTEVSNDALLNKIYANLVLTGQKAPDGNSDVVGDEGASNLIRQVWNANELTTDEALCCWGDAGVPEYNHNSYSDSHPMMQQLYYRLLFGVTVANFYLAQETGGDAATLQKRAEARFLRAYFYYHLMDLYGNPPMITEVSSESPRQASRAEAYAFVESELLDVTDGQGETLAQDPGYGRASLAAGQLLLARLYLNAEVYTGKAQWAKARAEADRVIASPNHALLTQGANGYTAYQMLFMGDNCTNGAQKENIFVGLHDGQTTQTWGGSLFVIAGCVNDKIIENGYNTGTSEKWGGNRARRQFVEKFVAGGLATEAMPDKFAQAAQDDRALFCNIGHTLSITKESDFMTGYAYVKFLNVHSDGTAPHHTQYVDTDYPLMRMAEAYLTAAEADARLGGGTTTAYAQKITDLHRRANCDTFKDKAAYTLDDICDEWSKEFGFEGRRRMDLVRFGKFGGQSKYKWEWMGGAENGTAFPATRNIFAIPVEDINANPNLKQNPGY